MPTQDLQDITMDAEQDTEMKPRSGRSAAGQKGGKMTFKRKGSEFYREIGRKGGKSRGNRVV